MIINYYYISDVRFEDEVMNGMRDPQRIQDLLREILPCFFFFLSPNCFLSSNNNARVHMPTAMCASKHA